MDGPHEGSRFLSTKWTDPIRVKKLTLVHKVDGPHGGSRFLSTKWTDPTRVKTYISPQGGRTPRGIKILVHKMDGSNKGQKTYINP